MLEITEMYTNRTYSPRPELAIKFESYRLAYKECRDNVHNSHICMMFELDHFFLTAHKITNDDLLAD